MRPQGLIEPTFWVSSCDLQLSRCITNRPRWFESLIIYPMQFGLDLYHTSSGDEMSLGSWWHGEKIELFIMASLRQQGSFSKLFECENLWGFNYTIGWIWSMFTISRKMSVFHDCDGELTRPEVPFRILIVLSAYYTLESKNGTLSSMSIIKHLTVIWSSLWELSTRREYWGHAHLWERIAR
jgi:hypothetical protein